MQTCTANNNTAFGYGALGANTTGTQNTAVGQALASNTTANNNIGCWLSSFKCKHNWIKIT